MIKKTKFCSKKFRLLNAIVNRKLFKNYQKCPDKRVSFIGFFERELNNNHINLLLKIPKEYDVLNISGHRLGTAEVESALVEHELVAEAAVVGFPHPVKGQGIYAYVTLMKGSTGEQTIIEELKALVSEKIGPIAKPDIVQWAPNLPKTRSGKIMRRILRKIAEGEVQQLGDTSTLADPGAVDELISNRPRLD